MNLIRLDFPRIIGIRQDVPVPRSFIPSDLSNLIGWYSAKSGVYSDAGSTPATESGLVQQWNDKSSASNYLTQSSGALQGAWSATSFNSRPGITFDGSNDMYQTVVNSVVLPSNPTTIMSVFAALRVVSFAANDRVMPSIYGNAVSDEADWNSTNAAVFGEMDTSTTIRGYRNGSAGDSNSFSTGTNYRVGSVYDGTNHTLYVNNVSDGSTAKTVSFDSPATFQVPGAATRSVGTAVGNVIYGEIIICASAPDSATLAKIDAYFVSEWGL